MTWTPSASVKTKVSFPHALPVGALWSAATVPITPITKPAANPPVLRTHPPTVRERTSAKTDAAIPAKSAVPTRVLRVLKTIPVPLPQPRNAAQPVTTATVPVRAAAARLIPARRSAPTSAAKAAENATVHVRRAIPHRQHPNVMTPRRTNAATPVTRPRTVIRARDIMTAAAAGSIVKEAFVRRTVPVAAHTAKATTSRIPVAAITVPVTATTATVTVRFPATRLKPIRVPAPAVRAV